MSLKRHFLISAAAAVLSHQALGAAKPVVKYEVVEKFETAPSDAEIRQAVLAFELAEQEKSKIRANHFCTSKRSLQCAKSQKNSELKQQSEQATTQNPNKRSKQCKVKF